LAAVSGVLIDTSAWVRAGTSSVVGAAVEDWLTAGVAQSCPVLDLEVLYTARGPSEYESWHTSRAADYDDIPLSASIGARALEVQRQLARSGRHRAVRYADLLIAACAEAVGAVVVHYDADYDLIAEVTGQPTQWVVPRGSVD
jgi:predicted nucleic acid-binding protein